PRGLVQACIAVINLLLGSAPPTPRSAARAVGSLVAAAIATSHGLSVGGTGPRVAAVLERQQKGDRFSSVATFAAAMCLQHAPKAIIYGAAGFVFADWLGLIVLMILSGAVGTWLGLRLLRRLNDRRFTLIFNLLLTLLALRLVWQALLAG